MTRAQRSHAERMASLQVQDLIVQRDGRPVVEGVTLEIPPGEVTALLGPNGAGKSSLVLAVGGVLRPAAGTITIGDKALSGLRPDRIRAAGVAIVPEGRRLLGELTVADNLQVATYTLPRGKARAAQDRALELFPELRKRLDAKARMLSGGEQQMVVLAQAIVSQPKYMLIDELSLGLAPVIVRRLVPVIREIAASGIGVLLIEQFAAVALELASSAHVIEGGQIRFSGEPAQLRDHPELLHTAYLQAGAA
jgi:branched-chain amino acid transport system ATP-binding protein